MIIFDLVNPFKTSDNFQVKLKGFVKLSDSHEEGKVIAAIESSVENYLATIPLLDALDLVNTEEAKKLIPGLGDLSAAVTELEISTVDAVEEVERKSVDYEIDPELESQKQNQGFFSRMKELFKR